MRVCVHVCVRMCVAVCGCVWLRVAACGCAWKGLFVDPPCCVLLSLTNRTLCDACGAQAEDWLARLTQAARTHHTTSSAMSHTVVAPGLAAVANVSSRMRGEGRFTRVVTSPIATHSSERGDSDGRSGGVVSLPSLASMTSVSSCGSDARPIRTPERPSRPARSRGPTRHTTDVWQADVSRGATRATPVPAPAPTTPSRPRVLGIRCGVGSLASTRADAAAALVCASGAPSRPVPLRPAVCARSGASTGTGVLRVRPLMKSPIHAGTTGGGAHDTVLHDSNVAPRGDAVDAIAAAAGGPTATVTDTAAAAAAAASTSQGTAVPAHVPPSPVATATSAADASGVSGGGGDGLRMWKSKSLVDLVHAARQRGEHGTLLEDIPMADLQLQACLGAGTGGRAFKALWKRRTALDGRSMVVVAKQLHSGDVVDARELLAHARAGTHPHVVALYGVAADDGSASSGTRGRTFLVMEHVARGSLAQVLGKHGAVTRMRHLMRWAWQLADGVAHLHSLRIVHRDLAARNVLVSATGVLKVADFGYSRTLHRSRTQKTVRYIARLAVRASFPT